MEATQALNGADSISTFVMNHFIDLAANYLMPMMLIFFVIGIGLRALIYYTIRAELNFSKEFEKRVFRYLGVPASEKIGSYFHLAKALLEKTYIECFEVRSRYKRRNLDHVTTLTDRIFLIEAGVASLIKDTLISIRYFRKDGPTPRFIDVSKNAFDTNASFNRIVGILPAGIVHDFLNILPGLFIIGGIFGTFLGIMQGLPGLGKMDLSDVEASKQILDVFLVKTAYSMITSIIGIVLSVGMTLINTFFSVEGPYFNLVNRYASALETLWNESISNDFSDADLDPSERKQKTDRRERTQDGVRADEASQKESA